MNSQLMVHYAVACLEGLEHPLTPWDLSRTQNVPFEDCLYILRQFELAGIVRENAQGLIERICSMDDVTALQVLQALWSPATGPTFRVLFGTNQLNARQVTQSAVRIAACPRG